MGPTIRAFIAIELTAEIKNQLGILIEQLKTSRADVKWVSPTNIHLTLKFLGDVPEKKLPSVHEALAGLLKNHPAFSLSLEHLGAFPTLRHPRIIWVGINKGADESTAIATAIDNCLCGFCINKETRPFSAHITLGRVRSGKNLSALATALTTISVPRSSQQNVPAITFFKSTLTPHGPIYDAIKNYPLAA